MHILTIKEAKQRMNNLFHYSIYNKTYLRVMDDSYVSKKNSTSSTLKIPWVIQQIERILLHIHPCYVAVLSLAATALILWLLLSWLQYRASRRRRRGWAARCGESRYAPRRMGMSERARHMSERKQSRRKSSTHVMFAFGRSRFR